MRDVHTTATALPPVAGGSPSAAAGGIHTTLRCARCRSVVEHVGQPTRADFDLECVRCRLPMAAVTVAWGGRP